MSLIKIIFLSLFFYHSSYSNFQLPNNLTEDTILKKFLDLIIEEVMDAAGGLNIMSNLTRDCRNTLDRTFFIRQKNDTDEEENILANYYYSKIIFDSSTNVNDLSSYPNCMNRNHQYDFSTFRRKPLKPKYVTVFVDYRDKMLEYFRKGDRTTTYLIGICFVENCTEEDHKVLLTKIMNSLKLIRDERNFKLNLYSLNSQDYKPSFISIFLKFIPLHIITIHLFIVLFHKYIEYIYKKIKDICCDTHTSRKIIPRIVHNIDEENLSSDSFLRIDNKNVEVKQHQNFKNYMRVLFNIDKNFYFLTKMDDKHVIHNDSGLSYMNGIKGISMITALFGFIFVDLYNSPITKQTIESFFNNLNSPFFSVFYFGIKFAPKLLLCSSGFSLFYKFMCYLDDKFEAEKTLKKVEHNELAENKNNGANLTDEKNHEFSNSYSKSSSNNDSSSGRSRKIKGSLLIPYKYLFLFIGSQLHKYILYLLILFFILYSFFDFALLFIDLGPMWSLFNKLLIESSHKFSSIFPSIFCFQGYFTSSLNKDSILNYFHLAYQEVLFFLFSTLFIFIGYRYYLRMDRFILSTILLLWLFRIIYYALSDDLNVKEYYSFKGYYLFYNSILYNYLYYALGIYFGCLNYVIQKRYTYYECDKQNKIYLLGFTRLLKIIKKRSKLLFYILGIVFLILTIVFAFGQYILFKYNDFGNDYDGKNETIPKKLTDYNNDTFISVWMLIDADIVVLLVNLMALFFYLKSDNFINGLLTLNFWGIFNKIYFSFILLVNPVILYVFYITESKIEFNMENCYLYSFACGIIIICLVILVYALLELPYKKTIKLFLKRNEIKVGQKTLGYMEKNLENNSFSKQMELKGDLVKNKDDSFNEDDNEENEEDNLEIKLNEKFVDTNKEKDE